MTYPTLESVKTAGFRPQKRIATLPDYVQEWIDPKSGEVRSIVSIPVSRYYGLNTKTAKFVEVTVLDASVEAPVLPSRSGTLKYDGKTVTDEQVAKLAERGEYPELVYPKSTKFTALVLKPSDDAPKSKKRAKRNS